MVELPKNLFKLTGEEIAKKYKIKVYFPNQFEALRI